MTDNIPFPHPVPVCELTRQICQIETLCHRVLGEVEKFKEGKRSHDELTASISNLQAWSGRTTRLLSFLDDSF
jgi:hypothetical protein